jgi:hypothetical protein
MMKNITLAVDDELLARYRLLAAQQKSTVNAMVRRHMEEATGAQAKRRNALERLADLSRKSEAYDQAHPVSEDEGARFSREDTYSGRRFDWPRSN